MIYEENYKSKNPIDYLYRNPDKKINKAKLGKSMTNYMRNAQLHLLTKAAATENKIVVPFNCFSWKRIRKLKDENTFFIKINSATYFIIGYDKLTKLEKEKYNACSNQNRS